MSFWIEVLWFFVAWWLARKLRRFFRMPVFILFCLVFAGGYVGIDVGRDWYYNIERQISSFLDERQISSFLEEMNPELNKKMAAIGEEIFLADKKIQQLNVLKEKFPKQNDLIYSSINRWKRLKKQLDEVWDNIHQQVERAYVVYKIDQIQGKHKFSVVSKDLLNEANVVLVNAEATKSILEKQLLFE